MKDQCYGNKEESHDLITKRCISWYPEGKNTREKKKGRRLKDLSGVGIQEDHMWGLFVTSQHLSKGKNTRKRRKTVFAEANEY